MFDQLFECPLSVARYRNGPMLQERLAFLTHLANQGSSRSTLRSNACLLLAIAHALGQAPSPQKNLPLAAVKRKMAKQRRSGRSLYPLAVRWLRFMGCLQEQPALLTPWAKKMKAFADYMEREAELAPVTIYARCWWVRKFFSRLRVKGGSLHEITVQRIDTALQRLVALEGYSRVSIQGCATAL